MKTPLIETSNICAITNENRVLFQDLTMSLSHERVALIGRNGIGKSTLLRILSGTVTPNEGKVILHTNPYFVCQYLNPQQSNADVKETLLWFQQLPMDSQALGDEFVAAGLEPPQQLLRQKAFSHGEFRKLKMLVGKLSHTQLLILDEPTQDLDESGILWLRKWLSKWQNGLIVASHEPQILQDFQDFFIMAETGCRYFSGSFAELEEELDKEYTANQTRYLQNLNRLVKKEEHTLHIANRRGRKKRYGRISELDRATSRQRLNQKRDYAQVKHGKMKKGREARLNAIREWTKSTRKTLHVELPLVLPELELQANEHAIVTLENISSKTMNRCLFKDIFLYQKRERVAITGTNGAGKTTLLEIILGKQEPSSGFVKRDKTRIGSIAQGGSDWMISETLFSQLSLYTSVDSPQSVSELLITHKFPLALALRPMSSLSPGERVRAALICLFQQCPTIELLVLDEPTCSLDLIGQRALTKALQVWTGGLIIASHNVAFLEAIGIHKYLKL